MNRQHACVQMYALVFTHMLKTDRASFPPTLQLFRMQIKLNSVKKRPKADAHNDNTGS